MNSKGSEKMSEKTANNYKVLANSYLEEGMLLKAKKFYRKAYLEDADNLDLIYDLALIVSENNDNQEAFFYYDAILKIDQKQSGAYYGKAIIYDELLDYENAKKYYHSALEYDPNYFHAYLYLADIYEREASNDAEFYYKKAIEVKKNNIWAYLNYGSYLEKLDRNEEAYQMFLSVSKQLPEHYLANFNRGVVLKKEENYPEAIMAYEESIRNKPDYPYAYLNLAILYKERSNYPEAEKYLDAGIDACLHVSVLFYNRGIIRLLLNKKREAITDIIQAVSLSNSLRKYALEDHELKDLELHKYL